MKKWNTKMLQGKLYYIKYLVEDGSARMQTNNYIVIATQRPETIMGDTADLCKS